MKDPVTVKEVNFRPIMEEADFEMKKDAVIRFLKAGYLVKACVRLRSREIAHPEVGISRLETLTSAIETFAAVLSAPVHVSNHVEMVFTSREK